MGGGPAGYPAAIKCARAGKKVCLIEENQLGGICLNKGCIPTKALYRVSKEIKPFPTGGVTKTVSFDWSEVLSSINKNVVVRLRMGINFLLKQNGISVIQGKGTLVENTTVRVNEETVEGHDVVLATGSNPVIPEIFKNNDRVMTSDDFWTIGNLPESLAIIGGGAIGCEFAAIMRNFGISVSIYEMCDSLLPGTDKDIVKILTDTFKKKNITVHTGTCIKNLDEIEEDKILLAIGRTPNIEGLSEKDISIQNGAVQTDTKLRTSIDHLYAAGDINGKHPLAYVATKEGEIAAANICDSETEMDYSDIPTAIFAQPEIGCCGLTEEQAKEQNIQISCGKFPYQALGRAYADAETTGLCKIIAEKNTGKILGIHIVGEKATELVMASTLAIKNKLKVDALEEILYCHPTFAEAIMEAAADVYGNSIHLPPAK